MSDVRPQWRKSTHSFGNGDCIEVAVLSQGEIGVRDSKDPEGPVLRFTPAEWAAFMEGTKAGEFDDLG